MAVSMTCPNCGGPVNLVLGLDAVSAPYICAPCHRGWWGSELTAEARDAWHPQTRTFRGGVAQVIADRVQDEIKVRKDKDRGNSK